MVESHPGDGCHDISPGMPEVLDRSVTAAVEYAFPPIKERMDMNLKSLCLVSLLSLMLAACGSLTRSDTNPWLDSRAGAVNENIAGKWTTAGGVGANWGDANLIQDGSRFYGTLGAYNIEGSINGDHLYLALSSGKKVYYTARLKRMVDGSYAGKVVEGAIIDHSNRADDGFALMTLRRIGS